jgi:hypothetical protein
MNLARMQHDSLCELCGHEKIDFVVSNHAILPLEITRPAKDVPMEQPLIIIDEPMRAPMPAWAYPILNPTLKFLLRTPLHGILSGGAMILIFAGRKSGKRYEVVVAYQDLDGKLYTFSGTGWSTNFIGGAPVALRLRGMLVRATARVLEDPALIGRVIRHIARGRGEQIATSMGLIGHGPDGVARLQMPKGSRLVEFTLER